MQKTFHGRFCSFLCIVVSVFFSGLMPGVAEVPKAAMPERHRSLLEAHCQACHGPEKQKGKFRVDDLPLLIADLPTAERWQKVLNALNSGEMPPEEEKQPEAGAKTDFLDDLSNMMVTARKSLSDQHGTIALRRLNRREYRNTLRDLLGVEMDVSELPSDTGGAGFDTVGANLFLTGNQFEQYEDLGREALTEAFNTHANASVPRKHHVEWENQHRVFLKKNRDGLDAMERATGWIKAVDSAVALPENAATVGELRKIAATDDALRHHWKKISGAPSPMDFGFDKVAEVNPAGIYLHRDQKAFIGYDEYYLKLPHLETGIYLTVPSRIGGGNNVSAVPSLAIPADFPPGEYVVRIRVGAVGDAAPERRFLEFGLKGFAGVSTPALSTHHVTGSLEDPQIIEIPFILTRKNSERGHRNLFIRERGAADPTRNGQRMADAVARNGIGPEVAIWVDWMEIERKKTVPGAVPPGIRVLEVPLDDRENEVPRDNLRSSVERFVVEAYRGVAAPEGMVERLLGIYDSRRRVGDKHSGALKQTLSAVLSSPRFLYRAEPASEQTRRNLDGLELATRLSYFLRGGPPDETLRGLGASGELLNPRLLFEQTDRLMSHPDSVHFVRPFLTQWLTLDRLDLFQFSKTLFPRFDDAAKAGVKQEVYETFSYLLQENGPLTDLLTADYAVLNGLVAEYYGIQGVAGDEFRKVLLPAGSPRGGLLGMAAITAMGGNGQRTNPVERGAWVLRKILNEPPPPAPANVPEIARLAGKLLTTRERLQAHQENPQCANCHRKIDPIGFGLENFDATGQWRTTDSYQAMNANGTPDPNALKKWTIEASAVFHKGPAFKDYFEMRSVIASKSEAFAKAFSSALIEYALGRPCGFSDEALLENLVRQARTKEFSIRAFIQALVQSEEFLAK